MRLTRPAGPDHERRDCAGINTHAESRDCPSHPPRVPDRGGLTTAEGRELETLQRAADREERRCSS